MNIKQRLVSTRQLAAYLGSTEGSIRAQQCKGNIPSKWIVKMGRSVRFDMEEVEKSINDAKEQRNGNLFKGHA